MSPLLWLGVGAALALLGLPLRLPPMPSPAQPSPKASALACPSHLEPRPALSERLWKLLSSHPDSRGLKRRRRGPLLLCFGKGQASMIRTDGVLYLPSEVSVQENGARLGHLLAHWIDPIRFEKGLRCKVQVRVALSKEARALALELRLRRAFGVKQPARPFAFARGYWQRGPEAGLRWIAQQLLRHPNGAPGIPALASQYRRRCQRLQAATDPR